jgi:RND superfamily putative drug exporter
MSHFLSQLGRFSARHRMVVFGTWILIFVALIATLVVGGNLASPKEAATSIPDSPASQALERMNEEFPSSGDAAAATLQLVFQPDAGSVADPAVAAQITAVLSEAADLPEVESVSSP